VATVGSLEARATLTVRQRPYSITKVSGDNQRAAAGSRLPNPLRVVIVDRNNHPIPGAVVIFEVSDNGGTITQSTVTADESGEASTVWTLSGTPGASHSVTARAGSVPGVQTVFSASATGVPSSNSQFDIELHFVSGVSASQRAAFDRAAARWETAISGDLPGVFLSVGAGDCGAESPAFNGAVDDLIIFITLGEIDGAGKVLGQAGPCRVRGGSFLPASGVMLFDVADVVNLEADGTLEDVVLHEMGHVLGIGTIWSPKGFLINPSLPDNPGVDTHFNGASAISAFNSIGGATYTDQKVPVENSQGGAGTRDSHWRESVFRNELMTGFVNRGSNPMSIVTIRSLEDLGYAVNGDAADMFLLASGAAALEAGPVVHLLNDLAPVPIRVVGR
jgi:hypothetical protein